MKTHNKNSLELGIDVGTTSTEMARVNKSGIVEILPNLDGDLKTPSIVSVAGQKPLVGKVAQQDKFLNPEMVAEHFKKLMDKVDDASEPVPLLIGPDGTAYTAVTLSAELVHSMKTSAEKLCGQKIDNAVVSVPAYFPLAARQATKDAALMAGFSEVFIVDEPTAAATYYGLVKGENLTLAVLDFGGGTFDVCILKIKENGEIDPIGIAGDPECGGGNIDEAIFQEVRRQAEQEGGKLSPEIDLTEWLEILERCKQAKEMLAHKDNTIISYKVGQKRCSLDLTYDHLKELSAPVIDVIKNCCRKALDKAKLKPSEIDKILLVGGSTRLRFMTEIVKDIFGQEPVTDTDPDFAVAKGNAIIAAAKFGPSDQLINAEGTKYLASAIRTHQIVARPLCIAVINEDDKDGKNGKDNKDIECNCVIIPAGVKLPYSTKEHFTPIYAETSAVLVKLIDGEPGDTSSNYTPLMEAQVQVQPTSEDNNHDRIELSITMDEEALVNIKARDKLLNKPVPISFHYHAGLSELDIEKQRTELLKRHKTD